MDNSKKINSIIEYIETIEGLNYAYRVFDTNSSPMFIFRGIADDSWDMLPSIFRTFSKDIVNHYEFRKYVNENEMYKHFIKEAKAYVNNLDDRNNLDYLEWIVYAQHFGVPTRLLDFSSNPLIALYFACSDANISDNDAAVWILNLNNYRSVISHLLPYEANKNRTDLICDIIDYLSNKLDSCCDYPIPFVPYYFDERMSNQYSHFLIWGKREDSLQNMFCESNYYMKAPIRTGVCHDYDGKDNEFLFKIVIPKKSKIRIIEQLDSFGVNAKMIFPGLDGLGKYIESHYNCVNKRCITT